MLSAHAHDGYGTYFVCMCVCVCPRSASVIKHLYSILNMAIASLLSVRDFQLMDLSKTASFRSYSLYNCFIRRPFAFTAYIVTCARHCGHSINCVGVRNSDPYTLSMLLHCTDVQ